MTRVARTAQLAPASVFLLAFLIAPLVVFLLYSFWTTQGFDIVADWTTANYTETVGDEVYRSLFRNTIEIALLSSVVAVVLAYVFAHLLRFYLRRWQTPLLFLVLIAAFSGYLVRIYAWRTILGEKGIINDVLQRIGLIDDPLSFLLYSRTAAVIVLANFLLPLALVPIYAALQGVKDDDIEAARDLGAGPVRTLFKVTLPLAWPGIFAAFALTFILAAGDFATPQLVGGTSGTMIGRTIADSFGTSFDWPTGAALSFTALVIVLFIVSVVRGAGRLVLR